MNIKFELETLGYISAELTAGNDLVTIGHSSDYEDRFQTLVNNLLFFHWIIRKQKSEYFPAEFETLWQDDFIHYQWNVSVDSHDSDIHVRITELYPNNPDHSEVIFNESIDSGSLFGDIYNSLDKMYTEFGLIGYKANWEVGNFPVSEYLLLKSEMQNISLEGVLPASEHDSWKQKKSERTELDLLSLKNQQKH